MINCVSIQKNWKEALVAILTYAPNESMPDLCTDLGHRLMDSNLKQEAMLCFICARNLGTVTKKPISFSQIFSVFFTKKIIFILVLLRLK